MPGNKKKIIFYCQQIIDDANRAQYNRARFLCRHYSVYIVSNGAVSPEATRDAAAVYTFPLQSMAGKFVSLLWAVWTAISIKIRDHEVEYIHSTYEPRSLIVGFLTSRLLGLHWVADLWDDPEKALMLARSRVGRWKWIEVLLRQLEFAIARKALMSADKVIVSLVPERIIRKYALREDTVLPVTNGINLSYAYTGSERGNDPLYFTLFYCGTVDRIRLEGLPACLKYLQGVIPGIRMTIIGKCGADARQWLTDQVRAMEGDILLDIRGRQPYQTVVDAIAGADVCICPYPAKLDIAVTYPIKIFDYMVMGKPVVASHLPGTGQILTHGEDALLFDPGNYEQMAECILRLYQSEQLREQLSVRARENVVQYSWDCIHARIYDFLEA